MSDVDEETAGQMLQRLGMDGKLWAEEMHKYFPKVPVDDLLGWCCNMIMAGYDEAQRRARTQPEAKPLCFGSNPNGQAMAENGCEDCKHQNDCLKQPEATMQKELHLTLKDMPPEGIRIIEPQKYSSILIVPEAKGEDLVTRQYKNIGKVVIPKDLAGEHTEALRVALEALWWVDEYISAYCILIHPKKTLSAITPEEAIRGKLKQALTAIAKKLEGL